MAEDSSSKQAARDCVEDYDCEETAKPTSCGCFRGLCTRRSLPHRYVSCKEEQEAVKDHQNWFVKEVLKKVKELKIVKVLSESLVGPKWKSLFMRRLRTCSGENKKQIRRMQFQYDPRSYALNFDDGVEKEDYGACVDFSARYAGPLGKHSELS